MPELPSHQDLLGAFETAVKADPKTSLTDFSDGSVNRGFAGLAATASRGVYRWIARQVARAFVRGATGADLDYVISDRVGDALPRRSGESDDDYEVRFFAYLANALERGTDGAWRFFLEQLFLEVDPLASFVSEDLEQGKVILTIKVAADYTAQEATDVVERALPQWRILGIPIDLEVS